MTPRISNSQSGRQPAVLVLLHKRPSADRPAHPSQHQKDNKLVYECVEVTEWIPRNNTQHWDTQRRRPQQSSFQLYHGSEQASRLTLSNWHNLLASGWNTAAPEGKWKMENGKWKAWAGDSWPPKPGFHSNTTGAWRSNETAYNHCSQGIEETGAVTDTRARRLIVGARNF